MESVFEIVWTLCWSLSEAQCDMRRCEGRCDTGWCDIERCDV